MQIKHLTTKSNVNNTQLWKRGRVSLLHKGNIVLRISILLHKNKNKKVKSIHVNNATHTYNFVLYRSITYHQNESKQENSFYILTITIIVTLNKLHYHSYFNWIMNYIS